MQGMEPSKWKSSLRLLVDLFNLSSVLGLDNSLICSASLSLFFETGLDDGLSNFDEIEFSLALLNLSSL